MTDVLYNQTATQGGSLGLELLNFDDDLAELSDRCAFMCDAVVSILKANDCIDAGTLGGIHSYSEYIKQHIGQLRRQLNEVRTRVPMEQPEKH